MKIFGTAIILALLANPGYAAVTGNIYQDPMRAFVLETPAGQYNAGVSLLRVIEDYSGAAKWFRRAAIQGHANAQAVLGSLYATGSGVPQDFVNAHAWISLALPGLYGKMLHRVEAVQDELETFMTSKQIRQAQTLTNSWVLMFPSMDR